MASAISRSQTSPHHSIVRVAGELDLVTAPLLRAVLKSADADAAHEFVVELSAVTFMDCSGLAPLLEARATLGGRLQLCDLPRVVSTLLHLAGLDATFAIVGAALSVPGGAGGPPSRDLFGRGDDSGRTVRWASPVEDDALGHADGQSTESGASQGQPAAPGEAIGHRMVIEQATGLLMASLGCDARQASRALLQISWDQDAPIHDVAVALIADAQDSRAPATATGTATTGRRRTTQDAAIASAHHRTDDPL